MIDKFLKAKHWQLFTLIIGIPIGFQIIMFVLLFSQISTETDPDPTELLHVMIFFPLIMISYMGLLFGWFWSVAIGLQPKVPQHVKMKTKKFKIFLAIPFIYIILISLFVGGIFSGITEFGTSPNPGAMAGALLLTFPLHLLSMFGIFYAMYFVAKTIKTVELQKEVAFGEFIGEFFMLWFYFIGIWFLQPKINKMAEDSTPTHNNS